MDAGLQAKLLRVLQERQVERLGGHKVTDLDVRVLATSNRNMRAEVTAGRFREDLFYRLNVFPIQIPALRDRPRDIAPLAERLLKKHAQKTAGSIPMLSSDAHAKLMMHTWPGNVRELDNVIQRAVILHSGGFVEAVDIQFEMLDGVTPVFESTHNDESATLNDEMKHHEYNRILAVLNADNGNRKSAAEKLGISQRTLRYKLAQMREVGLSVPGR
jgi:two-component system response regulator FlrC